MTSFLRLRYLIAALLIATGIFQAAALSSSEAFVNAPRQIFPLLDRNSRLDMIDYFKSGMSTRTKNVLNGGSIVTAMTPEAISVQMTDASHVQLMILPAAKDSLIAVITTVNTPSPDSKLTVYTRDWKKTVTESVFRKPLLKDWLTAEGRRNTDQVEAFVPFLLISYSYDPSTATLTLTNNTREFLSEDVYTIIEPYLLENLTFKWDGKRFSQQK